MDVQRRYIVNFYELDDQWQAVAINNLDECAHEAMYIEPHEKHNPEKHVLHDLTTAYWVDGEHDGFLYNAAMTISNNSAMLMHIDKGMTKVRYIYV